MWSILLIVTAIIILLLWLYYFVDSYPISNKQKPDIKTPSSVPPNSGYKYFISYDKASRSVYLNDIFLLATLNYNSKNHLIFDYLYDNPNTELTIQDFIDHHPELENICSLSKKIDSIGFKGDVRKHFFQVTKYSVKFTPEVELDAAIKIYLKGNTAADAT